MLQSCLYGFWPLIILLIIADMQLKWTTKHILICKNIYWCCIQPHPRQLTDLINLYYHCGQFSPTMPPSTLQKHTHTGGIQISKKSGNWSGKWTTERNVVGHYSTSIPKQKKWWKKRSTFRYKNHLHKLKPGSVHRSHRIIHGWIHWWHKHRYYWCHKLGRAHKNCIPLGHPHYISPITGIRPDDMVWPPVTLQSNRLRSIGRTLYMLGVVNPHPIFESIYARRKIESLGTWD